ncbi:MAG: beta-glucosidase [Cryptosporangiaceae bacterium]|nr:beta-glucosidase [Cryptosporangiaceae bacterium]
MSQAFPPGFLFGVATAAYQIEGAVDEDGRGPSIWDTFAHTPGRIKNGDTGDVACDHYHRYAEDVELISGLGAGAYRFSIGWPRLQPGGRGPVNPGGAAFYDRLVDALLAKGIAPYVTLYHWDLPQELEDAGGWMNRDTAERFGEYAELAYGVLGDRVTSWITLNEPFVTTSHGYALGVHAPGRTLMEAAFPVAHHQLLGHGLATRALTAAGAASVGITQNMAPCWPADPDSEADRAAAIRLDGLHNRTYADPVLLGRYPDDLAGLYPGADLDVIRPGDLETIAAPIAFLGVNYYFPNRVRATPDHPFGFEEMRVPGAPQTSFGWSVVPEAFTELLTSLRDRYPGLPPIYITENGCAYPDEIHAERRIDYLRSHLGAVAAAVEQGVDIRGYFCWSLMDNFEWAEGYGQRFGLVNVDYATQDRTPRDSYRWYQQLIAQ